MQNEPLFSHSGFLFIMFTHYNLEIVKGEEKNKGLRVCVFMFTHRNADASPLGPVKHTQCLQCRRGERPSNSGELRGRSEQKTDRSRWFIVLFWKSLQGRLLKSEHLWRTDSPRGEVTIYDVMNLDGFMPGQ